MDELEVRWCGYCRIWFLVLRPLASEEVMHRHGTQPGIDRDKPGERTLGRLLSGLVSCLRASNDGPGDRHRLFSETDEYFDAIEKEAYNSGELKL